MTKTIIVVSLLLLPQALCCQSTKSQSQATHNDQSNLLWQAAPRHEQAASTVISRALEALGGADLIAKISSLEVKGSATDNSATTFTWQVQGRENRLVVTSSTYTYEQNSGTGNPFQKTSGQFHKVEPYVQAGVFVPAAVGLLLTRVANDPSYSVYLMQSELIDGDPVNVVRVASHATRLLALGTEQTWYFSAASGLPIRIVYHAFDNTHPLVPTDATVDLSQYITQEGCKYPSRVVTSRNGQRRSSWTVNSVVANISLAPNLFTDSEISR